MKTTHKGFDYLSRQHCPAHRIALIKPVKRKVSITYLGSTVQHLMEKDLPTGLDVSITYLGSTVQHLTVTF